MSEIDKQKINELLTRGVEEIIEKDKLESKLKSGKLLRIKLGIDPTSPNLHIGRAVPLFKLRDFQKLGHKIVLIIGDFTGVIGDTSDKDSERPMLKQEQVKKNMESYILQAGKIINIDKCEIHYNSEWLGKLGYKELCEQADVFSLSDFISRENINKRLDGGKRVSLRELMYPLMQGYDSVAIKADMELGGTDQRFNLLAGRELQRHYNQEPQDIITNPLIEGLDGRKMSSSWGNTVNLLDSPNDMYGKVMSLKDEFIIKYFILTTRVDMKIIEQYKQALESGANPKDIKMKLAFELVRFYQSSKEAEKAEEYFINTFSKKETPTDLPKFQPQKYDIISVLVETKLVSSRSEARRVVEQNGVKIDGTVINDINYVVSSGSVLQKGKIKFVKIM
ncbi:MAG: tyrosine--tRNA ligase [Candidatus Thermoplasmatota archaeon]|nr:tyrosine--tRNA ligase [Candidatus Thermoplasmatota archaeon]